MLFLSLRGEGQRNADLGRPCERSDSQSAGQTEEEETVIIHKSAGEMIERLIANTLTTQLKTHPNILLLL